MTLIDSHLPTRWAKGFHINSIDHCGRLWRHHRQGAGPHGTQAHLGIHPRSAPPTLSLPCSPKSSGLTGNLILMVLYLLVDLAGPA